MVSSSAVKIEPNVVGGLATPAPSYSGSAAAVSPKREASEIIDLSFSDENEESFHTRDLRSPTVSAPPSRNTRQRAAPTLSQQTQGSPSTRRTQPRATSSTHISQTTATPQQMAPKDANFAQGMGKVGAKVKLLVDGLSDLRKFDLEHVVELPELVLVGDQSAGKSSLMSALTEIQLPRDQGICTKCPANIKTTEAEEWSCKVSLQQEYYYDDSRSRYIQPHNVNTDDPFPPWVKQTPSEIDFITITDKNDLEDAIKWAQIALLNQGDDHTLFIPGTGSRTLAPGSYEKERATTKAKFSPNVIAIDISGPGLTALSFYDLPGLFQTAGRREEQYLKGVIDNLAIKYIGRPNALIIWTLAMRGDPQTSTTSKVIMDFEATDRTVGVLTCPDLQLTRHGDYEDMLKGKGFEVKHGYFVTKQPDSKSTIPKDERYHEEARRQEMAFFNSTPLWKDEWKQFSHRFGTKKIQEYLSHELARQIQTGIPSIKEKIASRTRDVEDKLAQIPNLPNSNIRHTIKTILAEFSNEVKEVMYGESIEDLASHWGQLAKEFMDVIQYMKPSIIISHPSDHIQSEVIDLDSGDDDVPVATMAAGRKRDRDGNAIKNAAPSPGPSTPRGKDTRPRVPNSGRFKNEYGVMPIALPPLARSRRVPNEFKGSIFEDSSYLGKKFANLVDIEACIKRYLRPGFPNLVNPKTQDVLCTKASKIWREPMDAFFGKTLEIVHKHLKDILFSHLGVYEQTPLYRAAEMHLKDFINHFAAEQKLDLDKLYARETDQSFTMNGKDVKKYTAEEKAALVIARNNIRAKRYYERQKRLDPRKYKYPADASEEEEKKIDTKRINDIAKGEELGADPLERELDVAAYVRGYYITAATRFSDSVCLSIRASFFQDIRSKIRFHIEEKLGIDGANGEETCRRLMEEDDTIGKRRRDLNAEKRNLAGFSDRLARLVAEVSAPDVESSNDASTNGHQEDDEDGDKSRSFRRPSNYRRPVIDDEDELNGSATTVGNEMEVDGPGV